MKLEQATGDEARQEKQRQQGLLVLIATLASLIGLALAWRYTALSHWIDIDRLIAVARRLPPGWGLAITLGGFLLGSVLVLPLNLLTAVTVVGFGAWPGVIYAYLGGMLASIFTYGLGRLLGGEKIRRLFGRRTERVRRAIVEHGIPAVAVVRVTPIAPFTVVNLMAGAIEVRLLDFTVGTALGLLPGIVALAIMGDQLVGLIKRPTLSGVAIVAAVVVGLLALGLGLERLLGRRARAATRRLEPASGDAAPPHG